MRDLVWAALVGLQIENPIRPGKIEMDEAYLDYSRNVTVKEPLPDEAHEEGWSVRSAAIPNSWRSGTYALKTLGRQAQGSRQTAQGARAAKGIAPPPENQRRRPTLSRCVQPSPPEARLSRCVIGSFPACCSSATCQCW